MTGTVIHGDALAEMRKMDSATFGAIITSPPYNISRDMDDRGRRVAIRPGTYNKGLDGYDGHDDAMPHAEYVAWQTACLQEMWRLIRPDGAIFYNHRFRHRKGTMDQMPWIHTAVPVRQIIIWNRGKSQNNHDSFYSPIYENIYLIAGPKWQRIMNPIQTWGKGRTPPRRIKRTTSVQATDIWTFGAEECVKDHPAAFPVELPRRALTSSTGPSPVLDPFLGSGSTAVAAEQLGLEWTGIEQSQKYCELARRRVLLEGHAGQRRIE